MTRRARVVLIVVGVLAVVLGANWFAITDHIGNLRTSAGQSSGDAVPELLAEAQDFRTAQTAFAVCTVAVVIIFLTLMALAATDARRARRTA